MVAVQLSPGLTWVSAGGVPIDVPDYQSLGTVSAGDTRTFGLRTNDPLGVVELMWFGWLAGWEPPVAFAYPSDPVAVKAAADLTGVNISASGPCTISCPAIYGLDPWLVTPTGVGDCVLTITALVVDLENPDDSFPALTYTIPVLPAAAPNSRPVAAFDVDQVSTTAPSTVQLDASGSSDGDGDALTYLWDFGNGSRGSGATASATYGTPGTYTVTLTVMDPYGATDTTPRTVTVTDPTPPVITPIVQGSVGGDGWHAGDVDVSWSVVDPDSPVTSTTGCDPVTISDDTGPDGTTITCSATSGGGAATKSFTFGRDATPPSLDPTVTRPRFHSTARRRSTPTPWTRPRAVRGPPARTGRRTPPVNARTRTPSAVVLAGVKRRRCCSTRHE